MAGNDYIFHAASSETLGSQKLSSQPPEIMEKIKRIYLQMCITTYYVIPNSSTLIYLNRPQTFLILILSSVINTQDSGHKDLSLELNELHYWAHKQLGNFGLGAFSHGYIPTSSVFT